MAGWSIAVQAFEVEQRAAGIAQFGCIGMGSQNGAVSRNIVGHKLTEDGPTSRGVTQGVGRVFDVSAIADTACPAKRVQELFVGLKRRQLREHPTIGCGAKRRVDRHFGSRRRQAMT
jgi:hypothetical protein